MTTKRKTPPGDEDSPASDDNKSRTSVSAESKASSSPNVDSSPQTTPSLTSGSSTQTSPPVRVPAGLHERMQHAAFRSLIPKVAGGSVKPGPVPGAPPRPNPHPIGVGAGIVGSVIVPAAAAPGGVLSSALLGSTTSSPLNRAAVIAAAERGGVKALHGLPCVNALWHLGSHTFAGVFPIHGIMDGYSRRLLSLRIGESHSPTVPAALFRDTVKACGCYPARVRADDRVEFAYIKNRMHAKRGRGGKRDSGSFIHGPPESNTHHAPIWEMLAKHPQMVAISSAIDKFVGDGVLDKSDPLDILALQLTFISQLNAALDAVRKSWNSMPIEESVFTKDQMWTWNIMEWTKRGKYPAVEPESVDLPREALAHHIAEGFVNYGAIGGPYLPHGLGDSDEKDEKPRDEVPAALRRPPLDFIGEVDPCLRLWLESMPLPKQKGYAAVRIIMGQFVADEFAQVASSFRVGKDRVGKQ